MEFEYNGPVSAVRKHIPLIMASRGDRNRLRKQRGGKKMEHKHEVCKECNGLGFFVDFDNLGQLFQSRCNECLGKGYIEEMGNE